jgi:hypothetical protein
LSLQIGEWKGRQVSVTSRLIPRFFWMTSSIDVFIDSRCVLKTGGQLKMIGRSSSSFEDSGTTHLVELTWGHASLRSFPIEVKIDEEHIAKTRVVTGNWPMALWPWAFGIGLLSWHIIQRK